MIAAGWGGSSAKETIETGEMSKEGKEWQSLANGMILGQLDEAGYDINPTEVTEYNDPGKASQLEGNIGRIQEQIDTLQADIDLRPPAANERHDLRLIRMSNLQGQLVQKESELNGLEQTTFTKYEPQKRPDARVQQVIDQYGADSQEVRDIELKITDEEVFKAESLAGIEQDMLKNMVKYASGDMSYSEEQAAQVETYMGPVREIIMKASDDLITKFGDDDTKMRESFGELLNEIDKTGFDVADALRASEIQINELGGDLVSTLKKVNESTEARFKFQQDLMFSDIDKQISSQAAMLGLPPGSQAENEQKAKLKQDVLTGLQLQLHEQELKGEMGIKEWETGEKRKISLAGIALASAQGEKRESVKSKLTSLTAATAEKEQTLMGSTGQALVNLEMEKQRQLQHVAYGNIPSMMGLAQGGLAFDRQQTAAGSQQFAANLAPAMSQLGVEQQRQFAETTTTKEHTPSFLDTFGQVVGIGAAAAGAATSGYSSMQPKQSPISMFFNKGG